MNDKAPSAAMLTHRAIESANNGDFEDARSLLAEAISGDPSYWLAWLWYAHVAETDAERKFCLQQAQQIKADPEIASSLVSLAGVQALRPEPLRDIVDPEPPPSLRRLSAASSHRFPWWAFAGAIGAAILVTLAAWYFAPPEKPVAEPIYVAFVSGLSGGSSAISQEMQISAQLSWDALNSRGGINGHPVVMLVYDDGDDPVKAEEIARTIVAENKVLAVIGHGTSDTCLAAGPIYAEAKILTVSSVCKTDVVTRDNDWFFRSTYDNRYEGMGIASYLQDILKADDVLIVVNNTLDDNNLADYIERFYQGGSLTRIEVADSTGAAQLAAMDRLWELSTPETTIVLSTDDATAEKFIVAMRNRGMRNQVIGSDDLGAQSFLNRFKETPQEATNPGYYSDGIIAASPMIVDSLSGDALEALRYYKTQSGYEPDWQVATTYDATYCIEYAMTLANVTGDSDLRREERQALRDAIDQMDSLETAGSGVLGPILFDDDGTMPRFPVFAIASNGSFVSAPVQIHVYDPVSELSRQGDLTTGKAFVVGSTLMQRQRIVFTGINFNEVSDLDLSNPSFYADFFIWFTYVGDDNATKIVFQNAVNPSLGLGEPIRESITPDGMKYRLYRVSGRFKAPLEFQDFPFDIQNLVIVFQNTALPSSELVYAVDQSLLRTPQNIRLSSGIDVTSSINAIPNWIATNVDFYQETIGSSSFMGDPTANSARGVHFSLLASDITIVRDIRPFLVKNLLPLSLLVLVTYVSLYFPHSRTGARVSFGITGILTGAVMLNNVTNSLPDVGYTVAIEWLFYAFILLSACCIIIGLVGDYMYDNRNLVALRRLDVFSHVFFISFVVLVVGAYILRFNLI